jgi:hypothetical protein
MTQQTIESTTQKFLDIHDITDDVLVLKDGSTAIVMTVNAMNFGLLAEPEQDAIMYSYAGLLNSINYPIQIVIRSQTKDVTSYLNLLKEEQEKSTSDLKRGWIERYRVFVSDLIKERNVLDKKFYIVVSATTLEMGFLPPSTVIPGSAKIDLSTVERSVILDKAKEILEPRRDHLLGQFARIGLYGHQLTTQELIQLFYLSYNPEAAEGQQITDTQSYTTPLVQASVQGGIMDSSNNTTTPATPGASAAPADTTSPTPAVQSTPAPTPTTAATPTPMATTPSTPAPSAPVTTSMPASAPMATTPTATPTTQVPVANQNSGQTPGSSSSIPNITKPTSGNSPATAPKPMASPAPAAAATPTPASNDQPDAVIQNEIDSSLKELGSISPDVTTPSATPSPLATPTPDSTPKPMTPSMGGSDQASGSSDTSKDADAMPPLPEI